MVGSKVNFNFIFTLESKINFWEETDGEVGEFTASSYRLATSKIAVWNFIKDLSVLRRLLTHEQRVRNVKSASPCGVNEVVYPTAKSLKRKEWTEVTKHIAHRS